MTARSVAVVGAGFAGVLFPLARLSAADEVFVCSSIREVMPVAAVDGQEFGLGPAAQELQQALRRRAAPHSGDSVA